MSLYSRYQLHIPMGRRLAPVPAATAARDVLLICDDSLGNVLMMSGVIRYLHKQGYQVTLVLRDTWKELDELLEADRFIAVSVSKYRQDVAYRIQILNQVRQQRYIWAAASLFPSAVTAHLLKYCGANTRYACQVENKWVFFRRTFCADRKIKVPPLKQSGKNYTDILELLARYYGGILGTPLTKAEITPRLQLPAFLPVPMGLIADGYVCYVSDTAEPRRQYPTEKLMPLLLRWARIQRLKLVVTGKEYNGNLPSDAQLVNLTGKTSLADLWQIIFHAHAVVGNETGSTHLAWILHKPTVMICGGGHFGLFRPEENCQVLYHKMDCFGCSWEKCICKEVPAPCVCSVSTVQIERALQKLL